MLIELDGEACVGAVSVSRGRLGENFKQGCPDVASTTWLGKLCVLNP